MEKYKHNVAAMTNNALFIAQVMISNTAKRPLTRFLFWAEKRVGEVNKAIVATIVQRGRRSLPYLGERGETGYGTPPCPWGRRPVLAVGRPCVQGGQTNPPERGSIIICKTKA